MRKVWVDLLCIGTGWVRDEMSDTAKYLPTNHALALITNEPEVVCLKIEMVKWFPLKNMSP